MIANFLKERDLSFQVFSYGMGVGPPSFISLVAFNQLELLFVDANDEWLFLLYIVIVRPLCL